MLIGINGVIHEDRTSRILEQRERFFQDRCLELRIIRISQWAAKREADPEGPGRPNGEGVLTDQADLGCGDTF